MTLALILIGVVFDLLLQTDAARALASTGATLGASVLFLGGVLLGGVLLGGFILADFFLAAYCARVSIELVAGGGLACIF